MVKADRINPYAAAPDAMKAMRGVEDYIRSCGLEHSLIELVKMRASQINGCAFCLDMHSKDARENGETEQRLYLLNAWREATLYSPREQAALAWTEALTLVATNHVDDALFEEARAEFTDAELTNLTTLVGLINAWNRFAISFRYRHG